MTAPSVKPLSQYFASEKFRKLALDVNNRHSSLFLSAAVKSTPEPPLKGVEATIDKVFKEGFAHQHNGSGTHTRHELMDMLEIAQYHANTRLFSDAVVIRSYAKAAEAFTKARATLAQETPLDEEAIAFIDDVLQRIDSLEVRETAITPKKKERPKKANPKSNPNPIQL